MKRLEELAKIAQEIDRDLHKCGLQNEEREYIGHVISMANHAGKTGEITAIALKEEGLIP